MSKLQEDIKEIREMMDTVKYSDAVVSEGLIKTYPINFTLEYVTKKLNLVPGDTISAIESENGYYNIIVELDNEEKCAEALRLFDSCGYHCSKKKELPDGNIQMQIEAKFHDDFTWQLRLTENYLVHITPIYYKEKILKNGLTPRCRNTFLKFPDRIYFTVGSAFEQNPETFFDFARTLAAENHNPINDGKYTIFKVYLNLVPHDVKFYLDNNFPVGVFTTQNINPNCIVVLKDIDLNGDVSQLY